MDAATAEREEIARERARRRQEREGQPERPDRSGNELIKAAARGADLTESEAQAALDFFLDDDDSVEPLTLKLNVGGPVDEDTGEPVDPKRPPKWIAWQVAPVDASAISKFRRQAQVGKSRRAGANIEIDETKFSTLMIVAGTVFPNIRELAAEQNLVDPADAVRKAFRKKPGLIQQVSSKIMDVSGFNDDDVKEATAAKN